MAFGSSKERVGQGEQGRAGSGEGEESPCSPPEGIFSAGDRADVRAGRGELALGVIPPSWGWARAAEMVCSCLGSSRESWALPAVLPRSLLCARALCGSGIRSGVAGAAGPASCSCALPPCQIQGGQTFSRLLVWLVCAFCWLPKQQEARAWWRRSGGPRFLPCSAPSVVSPHGAAQT